MLLLADQWKDYELIDMGNGEKLERWGNYVLRRPDPQVVWPMEAIDLLHIFLFLLLLTFL